MFLVDWAVKMRIRPPEFETSICDAKYHVSAAARRRSSPEICSGQFDVENPIVLISSGLLVQSDEGVSDLVVDRIDVATAINREAPGS
ncbi:U-box domain-containing protein 4-like [Dorcoceras hygrometricum]|uniref:U-box domain-containing protein 4-like n=1 Tax=Dorcoceras hygrometricum TaxID=472368 RepID=A0A2Z7BJV0_9LAMI|nr:U-box domain-containing protein 4-like [Dorcoceras hygrometricum]